jgi:hypothetical protein
MCYISALGVKTPPIPGHSQNHPLSHLQKDSKTSCDEMQHFDIFPQSWHHLWTAQFVRSENSLWGCPKNWRSAIWCEPLEQICGSFSWEKSRDVIYEDLPSETKKLFWNFRCSFDIPLSPKHKKKIRFRFFLILSSFRIQIEDENSHSVFWREICKWFLPSEFLAFYSSINLIEFSIFLWEVFFFLICGKWKLLE